MIKKSSADFPCSENDRLVRDRDGRCVNGLMRAAGKRKQVMADGKRPVKTQAYVVRCEWASDLPI